MQYKSNLKRNINFTFCKNYTTTSRAGQIRNISQTQKKKKKQLEDFGC